MITGCNFVAIGTVAAGLVVAAAGGGVDVVQDRDNPDTGIVNLPQEPDQLPEGAGQPEELLDHDDIDLALADQVQESADAGQGGRFAGPHVDDLEPPRPDVLPE
jgi:hypothetical protein